MKLREFLIRYYEVVEQTVCQQSGTGASQLPVAYVCTAPYCKRRFASDK